MTSRRAASTSGSRKRRRRGNGRGATLLWLSVLAIVAAGAIVLVVVQGSGSRDAAGPAAPESHLDATESRVETSSVEDTVSASLTTTATHVAPDAVMTGLTIAWQPSHQGDTGYNGWKEYEICGDIVERTVAALPEFRHVLAQTLEHGLTGSNSYRRGPSNTAAFDVELGLANAEDADVFVSIHNDGGAPSGVLGMCMPGDLQSRQLAEHLVASICAATGLPNRGIREERLYSLEKDKNGADLRLLLEIGDNQSDRALLENPAKRQVIADGVVQGMRSWTW